MIVLIPFVDWMAFRLAYFGSWLPNTALAKTGVFSTQSLSTIIPFLLSVLGPLGVVLAWRRLRNKRVSLLNSLTLAVLFILATAIFILYAPLDWMSFGRFFMPILPLVAMLAGYVF